jgi:hypothetical protein
MVLTDNRQLSTEPEGVTPWTVCRETDSLKNMKKQNTESPSEPVKLKTVIRNVLLILLLLFFVGVKYWPDHLGYVINPVLKKVSTIQVDGRNIEPQSFLLMILAAALTTVTICQDEPLGRDERFIAFFLGNTIARILAIIFWSAMTIIAGSAAIGKFDALVGLF